MDKKDKHILDKITGGIPARLARNLMREEIDTSEEDLARAALRSKDIPESKRRKVAEMLEKGAFRRSETVINEKTVAELDKYHERAIAKARAQGLLKDPAKDPWIVARNKRLAAMKKK